MVTLHALKQIRSGQLTQVRKMSRRVAVFSNIPNLLKELQTALPTVDFNEIKSHDSLDVIKQCPVLIGDYDEVGPHLYKLQENVKWLQGTWAGVEKLLEHVQIENPPKFPITRFSSELYFGRLMTEYVITQIVANERGLFKIRENQLAAVWSKKDNISKYRSIYDLSIGILGLGNIGGYMGKTLHNFGAQVYGYGRRPQLSDYKNANDYISKYFTKDTLKDMLGKCDYIINVLPNTPETVGLLNDDVLEHCKGRGTVFINIGRGTIISEVELLRALNNQWIKGAILDVFEHEPLPPDHPFWKHPQVTITPHCSGMSRAKDIAQQFANNLKLFDQNLPLPNVVDFKKGY